MTKPTNPGAPLAQTPSLPADPAAATATQLAPAIGAQVVELAAVRGEAEAQGIAYATEAHDLCRLAGQPDKAGGFIEKRTSLAEIGKALLRAKADASDASAVVSRIAPDASAKAKPSIDASAIYATRAKAMSPTRAA